MNNIRANHLFDYVCLFMLLCGAYVSHRYISDNWAHGWSSGINFISGNRSRSMCMCMCSYLCVPMRLLILFKNTQPWARQCPNYMHTLSPSVQWRNELVDYVRTKTLPQFSTKASKWATNSAVFLVTLSSIYFYFLKIKLIIFFIVTFSNGQHREKALFRFFSKLDFNVTWSLLCIYHCF